MYSMKNILTIESIDLPTCMYKMKNLTGDLTTDVDLKIRDQNMPNNNILELEKRQTELLTKLDKLYERIIKISSSCKINDTIPKNETTFKLQDCKVKLEETVINLSPNNLPWFLKTFLKSNRDITFSWHIHSSVPADKILKIKSFFEKLNLPPQKNDWSKVNLRLIFKNAATELRTSPLCLPIQGNVNILRFLCDVYPSTALYNYNDFMIESLLDTCYLLEKCNEAQKQVLCKKIFQNSDKWIYGNVFTIVDLAVYNIIKQWPNYAKHVPKTWLLNCENI